LALVTFSQAASAAPKDKVDVLDGATLDDPSQEPEPIAGAFSMLDRTDQGITTKVRTRARPGHAHTLRSVIFNAPQRCSDGGCGDDDVFVDASDHSAGFNAAQIAATRASVVWGERRSGGQPSGTPQARGCLGTGEVPGGPRQLDAAASVLGAGSRRSWVWVVAPGPEARYCGRDVSGVPAS
jgi:hypothetical protein